jgi:hypothetical protein
MRCWVIPVVGSPSQGLPQQITSTLKQTPVSFVSLAAGDLGALVDGPLCALDRGGQAWCRGDNRHGALGDGSTISRDDFRPVMGSVTFASLAASDNSFCGLDLNHHSWCWGSEFGTPVHIPTRMGGDIEYAAIAFSFYSACGIEWSDRQLYCWGFPGMEGVTLDGDTEPNGAPVLISGVNNLAEITGGHGSGLGVFRYTSGKVGLAGDLTHDPGYSGFYRRPIDSAPQGGPAWRPYPTHFTKLLTSGHNTWCGSDISGSTLCAYRVGVLLGVPVP